MPVVSEESVEIKQKTHYTGTVLKIGLAGAIVDIGLGKPALLHVSQIVSPNPDQPVKRLDEVLQVGQTIDVWVKRTKDDRIELTMVKPLDLEWRDLKKGMTVKGKVVRIEKFGAFVEIGAERPGLVHISELAHGYVRTVADVVKEGDEIEAQVLDFNRRKKQIKLSLKALQPEPVKEEETVQIPQPVEFTRHERPQQPRRQKKAKASRGKDNDSIDVDELLGSFGEPVVTEAEPTSMEVALREAMERAKQRKQDNQKSRRRSVSEEQENILNRTLENKTRMS
ncbi:MAG TPA: S1 RNA-binding domain-containing protein [Anaerolineaceae bacterium]